MWWELEHMRWSQWWDCQMRQFACGKTHVPTSLPTVQLISSSCMDPSHQAVSHSNPTSYMKIETYAVELCQIQSKIRLVIHRITGVSLNYNAKFNVFVHKNKSLSNYFSWGCLDIMAKQQRRLAVIGANQLIKMVCREGAAFREYLRVLKNLVLI